MVSKQATKQKQMGSTDIQMLDSYLSLLSKLYGIDFNTVSSKLPFLIQQLWHITIAWQCYLKGDKKLVSVVISNTCQSQHVFAFHFSCLLINLESAEQEERIHPPILASTKSLFVKCNFGNTADDKFNPKANNLEECLIKQSNSRITAVVKNTSTYYGCSKWNRWHCVGGIFLLRHWNPILHLQIKIQTPDSRIVVTQYHVWIRSHFSRLYVNRLYEIQPYEFAGSNQMWLHISVHILYAVINIKQTSLIWTIMSKCLLNWIWAMLIHCAM